jgi:uncharacterized protein (TIGR02757 family)
MTAKDKRRNRRINASTWRSAEFPAVLRPALRKELSGGNIGLYTVLPYWEVYTTSCDVSIELAATSQEVQNAIYSKDWHYGILKHNFLFGGIFGLKSSNAGTALNLTPNSNSDSIGFAVPATALEEIYSHYNRFEHIHPDPLEFVYLYDKKLDRELSGFIASALAYGRVRQILRSVRTVLDIMGPSPSFFLLEKSPAGIREAFQFFKHRFTTGGILANLLEGLRELIMEYGSLESCFLAGFSEKDPNILTALTTFVKKLEKAGGRTMPMFLPSPDGGSACKRLNLFLRWMVRSDNVDPGVWQGIPASHLVVPLDTHMHRIAVAMGLTSRKQADIRCALEITAAFSAIRPADPVRYDFALTRLGIKSGTPPTKFFASLLSIGG